MRRPLVLALIVIGLLATACNGTEAETTTTAAAAETTTTAAEETTTTEAEATGEPITIGVITSTSGLLASYGNQYLDGLRAGLSYATDGSDAVDGRPIEFEVLDDGGDPEQAITHAIDLVGRGVNIIVGTVSSGVAVQLAPFAEENDILYISGPAATDAVTGVNSHTFRSGRQSYQDVATAADLIEEEGGTVLVFAQDSQFGQGNVAAVTAILGARDFAVDSLLVPLDATEFTPFALQAATAAPDLLFVAWAGETSGAMWQALQQQGVFEVTTVATGLGDRVTWPFYGEAAESISFLSHYFPEAPDNDVNTYMTDTVSAPDLFTPDGFVAAQMIVQAISGGGADDVSAMIAALEGWSFDAPKGSQTIRPSDHAMIQPMFTARLVDGGESAVLLSTLDPEATAPPEQ
jgi:branched-chain amino acid transport system substrate-binding protein